MTMSEEMPLESVKAIENLNDLRREIRKGSETLVSPRDTAVMIFRTAARKDGSLYGRSSEDICHDLYHAGLDDVSDLIGHFYATAN